MVTSGITPIIVAVGHRYFLLSQREKKEAPFSMAVGNGGLMQECFPKHSRMGTARMKYDKETEEGKKKDVSMERSKAGTNKEVPMSYHYLIKIH